MKLSPLLASGSFLLLALFVGWTIFPVTGKDLLLYKQLVENVRSSPQTQNQKREGVIKEICYQDQTPLHFKIKSEDSELLFLEEKGKLEVIENLKEVYGWMQEEQFFVLPNGKEVVKKERGGLLRGEDPSLETSWIPLNQKGLKPMQYIRYFEADKASYRYSSQLFLAQDVHLWRYRLPGHELPDTTPHDSPLMKGVATSIEFFFQGKKFQFQAHHLKAEWQS